MAEKKNVDGMDMEKLEEFRRGLGDKPVTLGLEARSTWEGHSGRNLTHIGPFSIDDKKIDRNTRQFIFPYGAWKEVEMAMGAEGPQDRVEPVEMALGAMSACVANSIGLNAARLGIKLEGFEISVKTNLDPSVLFDLKGADQHTACMPEITCEIKVKGDLSDEDLQTVKRLATLSPVHGMVMEAMNIKHSISKIE